MYNEKSEKNCKIFTEKTAKRTNLWFRLNREVIQKITLSQIQITLNLRRN